MNWIEFLQIYSYECREKLWPCTGRENSFQMHLSHFIVSRVETMFCVVFPSELRGLWNNSAPAEAFPPPSLSLTRLTKLTDRLLTVVWRAGLRLTRFGKDTVPFSHSNINQHADDVRHLHVQASCAKVLLLRCRHTCDMDHTSFNSTCNKTFFI